MPRGFEGEPGSSDGRIGVLSRFGTGSGTGFGVVGVCGLMSVVEVALERGLKGRRSFAKVPVREERLVVSLWSLVFGWIREEGARLFRWWNGTGLAFHVWK